MALQVHRAERADLLVEGLGELLANRPTDPFARGRRRSRQGRRAVARPAAVRGSARRGRAVQRRGLRERAVPVPARLVAALPRQGRPATTRGRARLAWLLLDVIDDCATEPGASPWPRTSASATARRRPGRRMRRGPEARRALRRVRRQRPAMLRDWGAGRDTDGSDRDPRPDLAGRPELWRCVRAAASTPRRPTARTRRRCARLRAEPTSSSCQTRLSVFGPTRLTDRAAPGCGALAEHRDVHSGCRTRRTPAVGRASRRLARPAADAAARRPDRRPAAPPAAAIARPRRP